MKKIASARLSVIISSAVLLLSVFALFSMNGSVAWFADNNEVSGNNMSITITDTEGVVEKVEFFKIHSIKTSVTDDDEIHNVYNFSSTPISDPNDIKLETFSSLKATRQLLIKITLVSELGYMRIVANSSADSYIIPNSSTVIYADNNSLSSVVELAVVNDVTLVNEDGEEVYAVVGDSLSESVKRFSSFTETDGEVTPSFSPTIDVYQTPTGETDREIYILVDYYEESMEYVTNYVNNMLMSGNSGSDIVIGGNINFACDFEILVYD